MIYTGSPVSGNTSSRHPNSNARADLDLSLAAADYIWHTTDGKGMIDIEVIARELESSFGSFSFPLARPRRGGRVEPNHPGV